MNGIYLRRRLKVLLPAAATPGCTPSEVLARLQLQLLELGFLFGDDVIGALQALSPHEVEAFHPRVFKQLRAMVGAHRPFTPMYPNFPAQVMAMGDAELYLRARIHYLTHRLPGFPALEREPPAGVAQCRLIGLGTRAEFEALFTLLAASKSPFSPQDQQDMKWFVAQYRDAITGLLPEVLPCKENLAVIGAELIRTVADAGAVLGGHVSTATDVLRVAVALSGGDVSLAMACRFGKFSRAERALLLGWIERADNRTEDMLRWRERWVRLAERLHPGDYGKRFPLTAAAFDVIRNRRPFPTFNGRVEGALSRGDTDGVLDLIDTRPGEFARRLDHLIRAGADPGIVAKRFAACADRVSTPVLLQVLTHFRRCHEPADVRVFFPKGNVAKVYAAAAVTPPSPAAATGLASVCEQALLRRFARLPALGPCFLDDRLKRYLVPFSQRSAARTLRTLVRGSRLPLPGGTTLRFFVWWKNGDSRTDIDLSAAMYDDAFRHVGTIAYYNLRGYAAHHSGDIVDAPRGAAEFIDVDIGGCLERGVRYVGMVLNSFSEQPYCDLPECFAGWMARKRPDSGEIFEPKTVVDKIDVASATQICLPAVFDLHNREAIWADIALSGNPRFANNVRNNLAGVSLMLRAISQLRKTDLHTLFELHVRARGERVANPKAAQTVFAVDAGITPFDLDRIAAEFL